MPAYAAPGTPDQIRITCRHIFRFRGHESAIPRPWLASGVRTRSTKCNPQRPHRKFFSEGLAQHSSHPCLRAGWARSGGGAASVKRKTSSPVTVLTS